MSWETLDDTLFRLSYKCSSQEQYSSKIAMFDLDHTLVKPRQAKKYPKNSTDWMWWDRTILQRLSDINEKGFTIVIITNQAGVEKKAAKRDEVMERIQNIFKEILDYCEPRYVEVYISLAVDVYRKPNTTIFEKYIFPQVKNKLEKVFYVGDAAGRPEDFSDSDRKFAFNLHILLKYELPNKKIGVPFATPEEFFRSDPFEPRSWSGLNPRQIYEASKGEKEWSPSELTSGTRYVILLVGPPASGKSTISAKIEKSCESICYVSQDICRTKEKCLSEFSHGLRSDKKIIIVDNTNPDEESRKRYIAATRLYEDEIGYKFTILCIVMKSDPELYEHLNIYRERISFHRGSLIKRVPEIAYRMFDKKYTEPSSYEDIDEIINLHWVPEFHTKYEILMFMQKS